MEQNSRKSKVSKNGENGSKTNTIGESTMSSQDRPKLKEKQINEDTGREVIPNKQRGCGFLKSNNAYIRGDAPGSIDGTVPRFVEFPNPIKFKVDSFRGVRRFPGLKFQLKHQPEFETDPGTDIKDKLGVDEALEELDEEEENFIAEMMKEAPDLFQTISRLWLDELEHEDANKERTTHAFDLITWIGESNYETPSEFIEETRSMGFNRGISVTKNREPPVIDPFRTRVFCVHPNAIEDEDGNTYAGVIGYAIVNRVIHTVDDDGDVPQYVKEYQRNDKLDVVEPGEEVPEDEQAEEQSLDEVVDE